MFFTSTWILTRSAYVEGILDGSRMADGKAVAVSWVFHTVDTMSGDSVNTPIIVIRL